MQPKLIVLYGNASKDRSSRVQQLVDGQLTCGYRSYAQHFGHIVYMLPVNNIQQPWEHVFPSGAGVAQFCHQFPDAIVWAVKLGNTTRDALLRRIRNRKLYYSGCARKLVNPCCDLSLVDTRQRLAKHPGKARLWIKGKDASFWAPSTGPGPRTRQIYDYVVMGRPKSCQNQKLFVKHLARECKSTRTVLWIGGGEGRKQIGAHQLVSTSMLPPQRVRELLNFARVGVVFTQCCDEGFPQTLLEMTMCGVPVVYSDDGPYNHVYFSPKSAVRTNKEQLVTTAERMLKAVDPVACWEYAKHNYSLDVSMARLRRIAKEIRR